MSEGFTSSISISGLPSVEASEHLSFDSLFLIDHPQTSSESQTPTSSLALALQYGDIIQDTKNRLRFREVEVKLKLVQDQFEVPSTLVMISNSVPVMNSISSIQENNRSSISGVETYDFSEAFNDIFEKIVLPRIQAEESPWAQQISAERLCSEVSTLLYRRYTQDGAEREPSATIATQKDVQDLCSYITDNGIDASKFLQKDEIAHSLDDTEDLCAASLLLVSQISASEDFRRIIDISSTINPKTIGNAVYLITDENGLNTQSISQTNEQMTDTSPAEPMMQVAVFENDLDFEKIDNDETKTVYMNGILLQSDGTTRQASQFGMELFEGEYRDFDWDASFAASNPDCDTVGIIAAMSNDKAILVNGKSRARIVDFDGLYNQYLQGSWNGNSVNFNTRIIRFGNELHVLFDGSEKILLDLQQYGIDGNVKIGYLTSGTCVVGNESPSHLFGGITDSRTNILSIFNQSCLEDMEEEAYVQSAQPASMYVGPGRFSRNRLTEKLFYSDDFGFVKLADVPQEYVFMMTEDWRPIARESYDEEFLVFERNTKFHPYQVLNGIEIE